MWRLSIATVVKDGPFSPFPGFDRYIMLLEGDGMVLEGADGRHVALDRKHEPKPLSGDEQVFGRLTGGPVRDFNLMVNRSLARSRLSVIRIGESQSIQSGDGFAAIHILEGDALANSHVVASGETVILDPKEGLMLHSLGGPAVAAEAWIEFLNLKTS
jgi:environmental stress-induced protein Ves